MNHLIEESMVNNVTVKLMVNGEVLPIAYEISTPPEQIISDLKLLYGCKGVSSRRKPMLIPHNNGYMRLHAEKILYIQSDGSYSNIHLCTGEKLYKGILIGTLTEDLGEDGIVRCHKQYAVNIEAIDFIGGNYLKLQNGTKISIGDTYKESLTACFSFRGTRSQKYLLQSES